MAQLQIKPGLLSLADIRATFNSNMLLALAEESHPAIHAAYKTLQNVLSEDRVVYGVNTGVGLLANQRIATGELRQLQVNLVRSHAAGVGKLLDDSVVRLAMLLKINSLARGYSGVRLEVIETLIGMVNANIVPSVPSKGSVGASGDLAPLAHMTCAMIGEGEVRYAGRVTSARDALEDAGLSPVVLEPKEGLAMLNGTQISTALALAGLFAATDVFSAAMVAGAMSVDAAQGSDTPFDKRIHAVRGQSGQIDCAACYVELLEGSAIRASHLECSRVQDPYSLRCQPQVMGACLDQMRFVATILEKEANAVSDNPLVFADTGEILSGGNFHAEPVAMAADSLAIAIAEIGALSERRIALLIDQHLSELPPFLVREGGLNSGFMIPQVTAAALASENKSLAHPASVDSLPTSANQEDHVSMATFAARRLGEMNENSATIVAIELMVACQGIDLRQPLSTSAPLQEAHRRVREKVAFYDEDHLMSPEIEAVKSLVQGAAFNQFNSAGIDP